MLGWLGRIFSWWQRRDSLQRLVLADGVMRTLFDDYAEHRRSERGQEEIGWVLLGVRDGSDAFALAALPAGMQRDAGTAHVRFHTDAQALASYILRQQDRRLQVIGVVHTHPGSMCVPSDGDLQGDRVWVRQLRGGIGVFGIGTATHAHGAPHIQSEGDLSFHWYSLGIDDRDYRSLPVATIVGNDLAQPLRPVWNVIEAHAAPLLRLSRQLANIYLTAIENGLAARIPLPEPNQQLRVLFDQAHARYYWDKHGELIAIDPHEPQVDRAVYLILAKLAAASVPREILEGV